MQHFATAARVDDNIYIGGYIAARDPALVKRLGVTRIVKMFPDGKDDTRIPGVTYHVVPADDVPEFDMRPHAVAAVKFIQDGLANREKILIHCHAGISRSSTIVLLHLMVNRRMPLDAALAHLRHARPQAAPNPGFMEFLRATDASIQRLRK